MIAMLIVAVLAGAPDARILRIESDLQKQVDGGGRIELPAGVFEGPIVVARDLVLIGAGRDKTIIDGRGLDSVVIVMPGVRLTLEGVTLRNGASELIRRRGDVDWITQGTGGALRALDGAQVILRHVGMVACVAAADGSMLMLGRGVSADLEDVYIGASRHSKGLELYGEYATWFRTTRAERVSARGLHFLDPSPAPVVDVTLWMESVATLTDVTLRERVGDGCMPRVWLDGKLARTRPHAHLEAWKAPASSCPFAYATPTIDVTYGRMTWPSPFVPDNIKAVR